MKSKKNMGCDDISNICSSTSRVIVSVKFISTAESLFPYMCVWGLSTIY